MNRPDHSALLELCRLDIPSLRPSGVGRWKGLCPFHTETKASFQVSILDKEGKSITAFYCFGCGAKGGYKKYLEMTGRKETSIIGNRNGSAMRWTRKGKPPPAEAIAKLVEHAQTVLAENAKAQGYLRKRNVPYALAVSQGIGYLPRTDGGRLYRQLTQSGFSSRHITEWRLCESDRSRKPIYGGRLIIPHRPRPNAAPTWFTARDVTERSNSKYLHAYGPKPALFNPQWNQAGKSSLILVEGPFDLLALRRWKIRGAAVLGTAGDPYRLAQALRRTGISAVALLPDNDHAGEAWLSATASVLQKFNIRVDAIKLSGIYQDPGQLLAARNRAEVVTVLKNGWQNDFTPEAPAPAGI